MSDKHFYHDTVLGVSAERVDSASDERTANNAMRHQYRVLTDAEKDTMVKIKDVGEQLLKDIDTYIPKGREASLAKTKVEEAVMWAIKGLTA